MKTTLKILGTLFLAIGLVWIIQGNNFILYKYFGPKQEQVRREIFEQTKSYNQGMIQEIRNFQAQYATADSTQRIALASVILHEVADYNDDNLPSDVKIFIQTLRNKQNQIQ